MNKDVLKKEDILYFFGTNIHYVFLMFFKLIFHINNDTYIHIFNHILRSPNGCTV